MWLIISILLLNLVSNSLQQSGEFKDYQAIKKGTNKIFTFYNETCCGYDQAESECAKRSGTLARIKNETIQNLITTTISVWKDVSDYQPYQDMYLVGAKQIGDDRNRYEWSDGEEVVYFNWYSGEPSSSSEKCIGIGSKDVASSSRESIFGYWNDSPCNQRAKFICENDFDSLYLYTESIQVLSNLEYIDCGSFQSTTTWMRNGVEISSEFTESIFQYHVTSMMNFTKINRLYFINPTLSDSGNYSCKSNGQTKVASVTVGEFEDRLEPWTEIVDIIDTTNKFSCSYRGRPIPSLSWFVNGENITNNIQLKEEYVTDEQITNNLTTFSTFIIKNPIVFGPTTIVTCRTSKNNQVNFNVNNDLSYLFDGKFSWKINASTESDAEIACQTLNGKLSIMSSEPEMEEYSCDFTAASLISMTENQSITKSSSIVIKIGDYTRTTNPNYQLKISNSTYYNNEINTTNSFFHFSQLNPETNYTVEMKFKPQFWKDEIKLNQTFRSSSLKPEKPMITETNIKEGNKCEIKFDLPENLEWNFVENIIVSVLNFSTGELMHEIIYSKFTMNKVDLFVEENTKYLVNIKVKTKGNITSDASDVTECHQIRDNSPLTGLTDIPDTTGDVDPLIIIIIILGVVILILIVLLLLSIRKRRSSMKDPENAIVTKYNPTDKSKPVKLKKVKYSPRSSLDVTTVAKHLLLDYHKSIIMGERDLESEYQDLVEHVNRMNIPKLTGAKEENSKKNRYKDILPYDENRIILSTSTTSSSDYINASWIKGPVREKIIAAQGPKKNCINDFWHMIYENDCQIIVMLTRLFESGKKKCEQYWPDLHTKEEYGSLKVRNVKEESLTHYNRRDIHVERSDSKKKAFTVTQFEFMDWFDHGTPESTLAFFRLYEDVKEELKSSNSKSIVVHCSGGVGRTGTWIAFHYLNSALYKDDHVNFKQTVLDLRKQRTYMVQTQEQYGFLHQAFIEYQFFHKTSLPSSAYLSFYKQQDLLKERIAEEWEKLQNFTKWMMLKDTEKQQDSQMSKLDFMMIAKKEKIFSMKTPTPTEYELFLDQIINSRMTLIVSFNSKEQHDVLWSDENSDVKVGKYLVKSGEKVTSPLGVLSQKFKVINESDNDTIEVEQVHILPAEDAEDGEDGDDGDDKDKHDDDLVSRVLLVDGLRDEFTKTLLHFNNMENSDYYCVAVGLIINDYLKKEAKIDVFGSVKNIRENDPLLFDKQVDYERCYKIAAGLVQRSTIYENMD